MDKLLTEANKTAAALNAEIIAAQQAEIRRLESENAAFWTEMKRLSALVLGNNG